MNRTVRPKSLSRKSWRNLVAVAMAIGALSVSLAATALAGSKNDPIEAVSRSNKGATELAQSIFEGNEANLVRAKFVTVPPGHDPVATTTRSIAGFPRKGKSFAILTTGCAHLAITPNNSQKSGCRDGGVKTRGARDVTIMRIRVHVPQGANCLSFRFKFLSEEFPEFVGTQYNDAFIAEVGHSPNWKASSNQSPSITAPNDFATTRNGESLITVNGAGVAKGTTYDAATGKLRASTPVKPGNQLLYLSLFDQGDRQYDSAVFIDRLLVRHSNSCKSGLVGSK